MSVLDKFTTWNLLSIIICLFLSKVGFPLIQFFISILKASSLLIAISTILIHAFYGIDTIISIYVSVEKFVNGQNDKYLWLYFVVDWILHIVPVVILGIPKQISSVLIAYCIIFFWYLCSRSRIQEIYTNRIPTHEYDKIMLLMPIITLCLLTIIRQLL
jgi:hypothetical protein